MLVNVNIRQFLQLSRTKKNIQRDAYSKIFNYILIVLLFSLSCVDIFLGRNDWII